MLIFQTGCTSCRPTNISKAQKECCKKLIAYCLSHTVLSVLQLLLVAVNMSLLIVKQVLCLGDGGNIET